MASNADNQSPPDPHQGQDIRFHVPSTFRLRFTNDVLGPDAHILANLLEPSGSAKAKVQFWLDANVADARPDLRHQIDRFYRNHADTIERASNIQTVPGGEAVKNDIHIIEPMLKAIHAAELDRRSYIVVIGGGAVLDAVGFAAAIAHRGIRLLRIPTTTLAAADSAVGVKNGVNLFNNKNWAGAFAVPWAVVNDTELLRTLGDRDFRCGFAEAVKVALLKDASFFERLCRDATRIRNRDFDAAIPAIRDSVTHHLNHITKGGDPFEAKEARPLDFGHWSAHKLEVLSDFQLRHGEAVAIGLAVDILYSSLKLGLPQTDADRALNCLSDLGLVLDHPALHDTNTLFKGMEEFRQHLGGRLTLTMLKGVAQPIDIHQVDDSAMKQAIERAAEFASAQTTHPTPDTD